MKTSKLSAALILALSFSSAALAWDGQGRGGQNGGGNQEHRGGENRGGENRPVENRPENRPDNRDQGGRFGGRDEHRGDWHRDERRDDRRDGWQRDDHRGPGFGRPGFDHREDRRDDRRPDFGRDHDRGNFGRPDFHRPAPFYPRPLPPPPPTVIYVPAPTPVEVYPESRTERVFIGRSVQDERISLSQLSNLSQLYPGWTIRSVSSATVPNSKSTTVVRLAVNDSVVATQTNPGRNLFLVPDSRVFTDNCEIELWVNGSTYIESIEIQLER